MTPQGMVYNLLDSDGWMVGVVERWVGGKGFMVRKDLYGFGDLLGVTPNAQYNVILQVTTASNLNSRVKKIKTECRDNAIFWLRGQNNMIAVVGIRKEKVKGSRRSKISFDAEAVMLKENYANDGTIRRESELVSRARVKKVLGRDLSKMLWTWNVSKTE